MRFVEIDGYKVDADTADLFYNANDGSRVTDEQWDESKRRMLEVETLDSDPDNPFVTWEPLT